MSRQDNILHILLITQESLGGPTKTLMPFLSFSDNLLQDGYIIFFEKSIDNFKIAHKTFSFLVWSAVPPLESFHVGSFPDFHFL